MLMAEASRQWLAWSPGEHGTWDFHGRLSHYTVGPRGTFHAPYVCERVWNNKQTMYTYLIRLRLDARQTEPLHLIRITLDI